MIKGLYPFGLNHYRSLKFQKLRKLISKNQKKIKVEGAYGSSLSFLLIDIFSSINQQIFYISNSKETASYVYSDIIELIGEKNCSFLPSNYRNDTKKIKDESNIINRSKTIGDILDKETKIIVTYPEAIFEKIPNEKEIDSKTINIEKGQFLKINSINELLFDLKFEKDDYVQQPGDFARRGNIVDIFSFAYTSPLRIEFDGDTVESIREFNIDTQYSTKELVEAKIIPDLSNESLIRRANSIVELTDSNTTLLIDEIDSIKKQLSKNFKENKNEYSDRLFLKEIDERKIIHLNNFNKDFDIKLDIVQQPAFNKKFEILNDELKYYSSKNYKLNIYFSSKEQAERFHQIYQNLTIVMNLSQ